MRASSYTHWCGAGKASRFVIAIARVCQDYLVPWAIAGTTLENSFKKFFKLREQFRGLLAKTVYGERNLPQLRDSSVKVLGISYLLYAAFPYTGNFFQLCSVWTPYKQRSTMNDMKCSFSLPSRGHYEREHVLSQMEIAASWNNTQLNTKLNTHG